MKEEHEIRRTERMNQYDKFTPEIRKLIQEYGYHTVNSFLMCGVKKPKRIRHLIEVVLDEFSPVRGTSSCQGRPSTVYRDFNEKMEKIYG